jgi:hypothetical protein
MIALAAVVSGGASGLRPRWTWSACAAQRGVASWLAGVLKKAVKGLTSQQNFLALISPKSCAVGPAWACCNNFKFW